MPLFVVLQPGVVLDDDLVQRVRTRVRDLASPRHVPDDVVAVRGIPHTKTGRSWRCPSRGSSKAGRWPTWSRPRSSTTSR